MLNFFLRRFFFYIENLHAETGTKLALTIWETIQEMMVNLVPAIRKLTESLLFLPPFLNPIMACINVPLHRFQKKRETKDETWTRKEKRRKSMSSSWLDNIVRNISMKPKRISLVEAWKKDWNTGYQRKLM